MPPKLSTLKQSIAIRPDCITHEHTTFTVKQKAAWSHGDFVARNANGTTVFTSSGKLLSNSARREIEDASGLPLFSLRRSWISLTRHYWLELPGGEEILKVQQHLSFGKIKLDFMLRNAATNDQDEVVLQLRGADMLNEVVEVLNAEEKVASIQRKTDGHSMSYKFLPEYEVEVAEGVDTSLVLPLFALHHVIPGQM
ncbi:MAG: hypothetical protein L6R38_003878 [Xanthoria sp. 2 TBL-2021]|nr:MAG: hypothetical protein L6R38_003878 [Xanthoria sp. 2 TBL-2021]